MTEIRDRFWLWGHEANSYQGRWNMPGDSRITPVEAAGYMGIPNLIMIVFADRPQPPFDQHALAMSPLRRVVWSIVGDSSSRRNDRAPDLDEVIRLAGRYPNICGAFMDDFFHRPDAEGRISRYSVADLEGFRARLHGAAHPLDLWVTLYTHDLDLPVAPYLEACDVITFWTWWAKQLTDLEANMARLEALAPSARKVLGCYMWDFGDSKPVPLDLMRHQCELGLRWLREGRIEGMIFLASCLCDLEIEAVEWARKWIASL